jgi:chemotaxis protein MotB
LTGCGLVPKSRLDDCRRLSQTLEAEKSRLKDTVLSLRSQYEDLVQRADDDARRLKAQDEEVRRLLASVQAYQDERDQLAGLVDRLKSQIQVAANPVTTALLEAVEDFAKQHPGCDFDARSGVLTVSSDTLFEPGSARLRPEAGPLLGSLADLLTDPTAGELKLLVAGHTAGSGVVRAGLNGNAARGRHLSLDRAARVRAELSAQGRLDAARIEVAGFEAPPGDSADDEAAAARDRRIEIHLLGSGAAPARRAN